MVLILHLSAIEHPGGEGVAVELFEMGLDSFIVSYCAPLRRILAKLVRNREQYRIDVVRLGVISQ